MAEKLDCQTSVLILGIFMAVLQKSDNSIEQLPKSAGTRERLLDAAEIFSPTMDSMGFRSERLPHRRASILRLPIITSEARRA